MNGRHAGEMFEVMLVSILLSYLPIVVKELVSMLFMSIFDFRIVAFSWGKLGVYLFQNSQSLQRVHLQAA